MHAIRKKILWMILPFSYLKGQRWYVLLLHKTCRRENVSFVDREKCDCSVKKQTNKQKKWRKRANRWLLWEVMETRKFKSK